MDQKISYQNKNFFQLFTASFLLMLGRVEHIIYVTLPAGIIKYLVYSLGVYLAAKSVSSSGTIAFLAMAFCIFVLNSFFSILIMIFLSTDTKSFFKPMEKTRQIFTRVFASDLLFLFISLVLSLPSVFLTGLAKTSITIQSVPTINNTWIVFVSALIWFVLLYVPYHGTIRPFMVFKTESLSHTWISGYKIAINNIVWIIPYYIIFGLLYFFLNPGFNSYILFEILNVILLPFQASLDLCSYRKITVF